MSTYFVINATVTDPDGLASYVAAVGPTLAGHDIEVLVATNESEAVEGEPAGSRLVILRFPDRDAFDTWYQSPAYQAIVDMRRKSTRGFGVLAESFA